MCVGRLSLMAGSIQPIITKCRAGEHERNDIDEVRADLTAHFDQEFEQQQRESQNAGLEFEMGDAGQPRNTGGGAADQDL